MIRNDPMLVSMLEEIESIDNDCILFNFECCSGCDYDKFMGDNATHAYE